MPRRARLGSGDTGDDGTVSEGSRAMTKRRPTVDTLPVMMSGTQFCVSDLVRLECRVGPLKRNDAKTLARFDQFFNTTVVLPIPPAVFDRAADLRARSSFKAPDALHLETARYPGCTGLWTTDNRFANTARYLIVRMFTDTSQCSIFDPCPRLPYPPGGRERDFPAGRTEPTGGKSYGQFTDRVQNDTAGEGIWHGSDGEHCGARGFSIWVG